MFKSNVRAPIYLGTADNALQSEPAHAEERLAFEHNVLVVLGYTVLVGTPFVWQSPATLTLVARNQLLLERPLPGLRLTSREGVVSAGDYFAQRASDTRLFDGLELRPDSPFLVEQPGAVPLDWRNLIGPSVQVEPRISSVERRFRSLVVHDAEASSNGRSIRDLASLSLGAKFSRRGRNRTDYILSSLSERSFAGHFSRAIVEDEFLRRDVGPELLAPTLQRTTALYQLACAAAHDAFLLTSRGIAQQVPLEHDCPVLEPQTISPANPYLFARVLECLGVRPRAWARLDQLTLMKLAHTANPLRSFALQYQEIVLKRTLSWMAHGHVPRFDDVVAILQNDLLLGDKWRSLELLARIGRTKSAPYLAGAIGAGLLASSVPGSHIFGATVGFGAVLGGGKTIKDLAKLTADVRDDLSFFDILRTRQTLRRYIEENGLTE